MSQDETQKFLRHWLLLLGAACVWFLWESRYVRNIWFVAMAGLALVCAILFFLTWKLKQGFVEKIPSPKKCVGSWIAFVLLALTLTILFFTLRFHVFSYGSGRFAVAIGVSGIFGLIFSRKLESSPYLAFAKCLLFSECCTVWQPLCRRFKVDHSR